MAYYKRMLSDRRCIELASAQRDELTGQAPARRLTPRQQLLRFRLDELPLELEPAFQAIYALARQGAAIQYVGRTSSPRNRYLQHVWGQCEATAAWMRTFSRGNLPQMTILQLVPEIDAPAVEAASIREHRARGLELLNADPSLPRCAELAEAPPMPQITGRQALPLDEPRPIGSARTIELEVRHGAAIAIALEAGTLARCERHGRVFDTGSDPAVSYRRANDLMRLQHSQVECFGGDRRALAETIKHVIAAHESTCPDCERVG